MEEDPLQNQAIHFVSPLVYDGHGNCITNGIPLRLPRDRDSTVQISDQILENIARPMAPNTQMPRPRLQTWNDGEWTGNDGTFESSISWPEFQWIERRMRIQERQQKHTLGGLQMAVHHVTHIAGAWGRGSAKDRSEDGRGPEA